MEKNPAGSASGDKCKDIADLLRDGSWFASGGVHIDPNCTPKAMKLTTPNDAVFALPELKRRTRWKPRCARSRYSSASRAGEYSNHIMRCEPPTTLRPPGGRRPCIPPRRHGGDGGILHPALPYSTLLTWALASVLLAKIDRRPSRAMNLARDGWGVSESSGRTETSPSCSLALETLLLVQPRLREKSGLASGGGRAIQILGPSAHLATWWPGCRRSRCTIPGSTRLVKRSEERS